MSDASMMTVRVEKPATASFGRTMKDIRTWLDHRNIHLVDFRPIDLNCGFGFELSFRSEDEARLFQREFTRHADAAAPAAPSTP